MNGILVNIYYRIFNITFIKNLINVNDFIKKGLVNNEGYVALLVIIVKRLILANSPLKKIIKSNLIFFWYTFTRAFVIKINIKFKSKNMIWILYIYCKIFNITFIKNLINVNDFIKKGLINNEDYTSLLLINMQMTNFNILAFNLKQENEIKKLISHYFLLAYNIFKIKLNLIKRHYGMNNQ